MTHLLYFSPLAPREDCAAGTAYYVCHANGFHGCCSVDACDLPGCPDNTTSPGTTSTTASPSNGDIGAVGAPTSFPPSPLQTTAAVMHGGTTTATTAETTVPAAAPAGSAEPPPAQAGGGHGRLSTGAMIGIALAGGLILGIALFLVVFLVCRQRRRRQRHDPQHHYHHQGYRRDSIDPMAKLGAPDESTAVGVEDTGAATASSPIAWVAGGDPFAPFGGRAGATATSRPEERLLASIDESGSTQPQGDSRVVSMATDSAAGESSSPISPVTAGSPQGKRHSPHVVQLDSTPIMTIAMPAHRDQHPHDPAVQLDSNPAVQIAEMDGTGVSGLRQHKREHGSNISDPCVRERAETEREGKGKDEGEDEGGIQRMEYANSWALPYEGGRQ